MKIAYIWHTQPRKRKTYDTVRARMMTHGIFGSRMSQEDFDNAELERIAADKASGRILEYEIIEQ